MEYNLDFLSIMPQIVLFLAALFGFIVGAKKYFKKNKALFVQIIVCALGCIALGQLFLIVRIWSLGALFEGFHVGMLGVFGCYLFLFSASFGQMDGLVDTREKALRKYRLLSLVLPLLIIASYLIVVFSGYSTELKIVYAPFFLAFAATTYYNVKHLLLPDVELGILQSIRPYNYVVIAFTLLNVAGVVLRAYFLDIAYAVSTLLCATVCASIVFIVDKGVKKWYL